MENSKLVWKYKSKKVNIESLQKSNILRAKCTIAEGHLGKALKFLLSDGLINLSWKVVKEMLAKHPQILTAPKGLVYSL